MLAKEVEMPTILINGCNIVYEEMGSGPPLVLTSGGRSDRQVLRDLAERLAQDYRVIIYDRRNTGASDVIISGGPSEFDLWAEDLYGMLTRLNAAPAYVGGSSNGCRTSLHLAIRHPEVVRALLLWNVADYSTALASEQLGQVFYRQYAEAAERGGMHAVISTPYYAERIQQNPSNLDRLLRMAPKEFIAVMDGWRGATLVAPPGIGPAPAELSSISAPAVIVSGGDPIHPRAAAEALNRLLTRSEFHPPVLTPTEREAMASNLQELQALSRQRIYPLLRAFLAKVESRAPATRSAP
jgi:pimeloyl-ACP methyl ester carboxylesterase